ncbi:MAG: hypothetical protein ACSHX7_03280 [Luteolibacter sp.]
MPIDPERREQALGITGSLRIACGDFHFKLRLTPEHFVADFPSLGMLLRAKSMGDEFAEMITDIPAPPPLPSASKKPKSSTFQNTFLQENFIYAAVNSRPVGKLQMKDGSITFRPTPFSFFSKLK